MKPLQIRHELCQSAKDFITSSLIPLAPWLPPITTNNGCSGANPNSARHAAASRGLNDALTGVPVMVIFRLFSRTAAD